MHAFFAVAKLLVFTTFHINMCVMSVQAETVFVVIPFRQSTVFKFRQKLSRYTWLMITDSNNNLCCCYICSIFCHHSILLLLIPSHYVTLQCNVHDEFSVVMNR